ncbi:MAG: hypothetical protein ACI85O_000375 [Saprospiraceae bacterium]|jgi:hypothetical protein
MKNHLYLFLLLILFSSCSERSEPLVFYKQKVELGDNSEWSKLGFDDTQWEEDIEVTGKGVFWLRINFELTDVEGLQVDQGMMVGGTGSYQIWLDDVYLGQNGELQTETEDEVHGVYQAFFDIPDSLLTEGAHVVAFRMTKQSDNVGQHLYLLIDDYFELVRAPLQFSKYMFLFAGVFLITAIYFMFVFFSRPKEISALIFSIICLIFCGLLAMEYLKLFYQYLYPFQRTRLVIIGWLHISLAISIPLLFMLQFNFPYKKILMGLLISLTAVIGLKYHSNFDWVAFTYNQIMWLSSFFITGFAVYQRRNGASIVFAGVTIGLFFVHILPYFYRNNSFLISNFDVSQFIAFVIIVLSMLYIMTVNQREERLAYEASLVLSERLKNELLKKNIKPHFIMNTLTSLIDWVEESPKEGVKFIIALAGEFETLNEIADYKLVPIGQEIKLCENHLKVMGYRKEISYKWEDKNIDENEIIPPAIIHTAVENGVTHSLPNDAGVITFRLTYEKNAESKKYILQTIARNREENSIENTNKREGTGLKYIKARLEESYPGQWAVSSQATQEGWETIFEIFV